MDLCNQIYHRPIADYVIYFIANVQFTLTPEIYTNFKSVVMSTITIIYLDFFPERDYHS